MSKETINPFYKARTEAGLTSSDLAKRLAVSRQLVCDFEKGHRIPTAPMLRKMARILRVPIAAFHQKCPRCGQAVQS